MRAPRAACREPAEKLWQLYKVLYVFEHKTQYLLIHAPFTRIVVFWHIGNVRMVKRTRVPAGSLVKMATDADVDSGRKRTLIQTVEAYTWNVLSGKIHGGIRNIQSKSRLRGTFHRCTIALRKKIFWRGCFVFMFCGCRGYLHFFMRVPSIFTRVPALYKCAWFVSRFHNRVFHRTLVAQTKQQNCEREFCDEKLCLCCIHLILCEIAGTS